MNVQDILKNISGQSTCNHIGLTERKEIAYLKTLMYLIEQVSPSMIHSSIGQMAVFLRDYHPEMDRQTALNTCACFVKLKVDQRMQKNKKLEVCNA